MMLPLVAAFIERTQSQQVLIADVVKHGECVTLRRHAVRSDDPPYRPPYVHTYSDESSACLKAILRQLSAGAPQPVWK